jgi:hypothetical protein
MKPEQVFDSFCEELKQRTEFISEDVIRYYWFLSMYNYDQSLRHYTFEAPYNNPDYPNQLLKNSNILKGKEMDLLYQADLDTWAMEIKFHRNPLKSTFAHTDAAGAIFADLQRLVYAPILNKSGKRLFLYVTDDEMNKYLSAGGNTYREKLKTFYTMQPNDIPISFLFVDNNHNADNPITFLKSANLSFSSKAETFATPIIRLVRSFDFKNGNKSYKDNKNDKKDERWCHVRLYEIIGANGVYQYSDSGDLINVHHVNSILLKGNDGQIIGFGKPYICPKCEHFSNTKTCPQCGSQCNRIVY